MLARRTLLLLAAIAGIYALLWLPAAFSARYLDSPFGLVAAFPVLSIYLFNMLGIPGLLENGGACGWGWCPPTLFGWIFMATVWLLLAWVVAWRIGLALPAVTRSPAKGSDTIQE
jgi:hypothetical protein